MFVAFENHKFLSMKKFLAVLILALGSQLAMSQSVIRTVWATDFENGGAYPPCSDTSNYRDTLRPPCSTTATCLQSHGHDWGISDTYHYNGIYADTAQVNAKDTLWFSTCAFSTLLDTFVTVEFNHIAKVSFFDGAIVQVSNNNGASWHTIGANEYINTKGLAGVQWQTGYGVFNDLSYAHVNKWNPGFPTVPTNTWWEYEYFNVSAFLGGVNASANCKVRWALWDGPTTIGPENYFGWMLDSIRIKSAPCENFKPRGDFYAPQIYNGSLLYSMGPFDVYAKMWDENSGFSDAWLVFTVNGGPRDSVPMNVITGPRPNTALDSVYKGTIPKVYNGVDSFVGGDTVCYWVNIYDQSVPCRNKYHLPNDPNDPNRFCNAFYLTYGRQLPYCDNFDNPAQSNFWDTSLVAGRGLVGWELGNPSAGGYGAMSPPNAWTTKLSGNYGNNDLYYLNSPKFDFTTAVTPRIKFWHRQSLPTSASDGDRLRLQYSINNNAWITLGVYNDPKAIPLNAPDCPSTWYNVPTSGNTNRGWSGSWAYNNQWREAFYQLDGSFTGLGQVQFRFVFTADNNAQIGYGASIDDWCLVNPPKIDVSCTKHIRPIKDFIYKAGLRDSSVSVKIRNLGTDTLMAIPVTYKVIPLDPYVVQSPQYVTDTIVYPRPDYPLGLPPLAIDTVKFNTTLKSFIIPEGLFIIQAYPEIIGDADSTNDTTATIGHFGFVSDTITHFTDFDSIPVRWTTTIPTPGTCGNPPPPTPNRWEWGTPNYGVTTGAYNGSFKAWDLNLNAPYTNSTTSTPYVEYLYSQIFDMTNADSAYLSFWHNRNTVWAQDGYYLDFSTNRGSTWTRLTAGSQPIGIKTNWTNSYPALANSAFGWSGVTTNWEYSQVPLNNNGFTGKSDVMFRFVFTADNANTLDGVSIDDFRIVNPDLYDVEMFDIILPERGCVKHYNETVSIVLKNAGKDSVYNIPVAYRYRFDSTCTGNYGPWSSWMWDTVPDTILPGTTAEHIFIDSVNMLAFGCYDFCAVARYATDINLENDTICGHEAENVDGCNVDLTVTTGNLQPDGYIIMQDSLTGDTLYIQTFNGIAPNTIQWNTLICLDNIGSYKLSLTSTDTTMISWWQLVNPYTYEVMHTDLDPGVFYFPWECPPLLSNSTWRIRPFGPTKLPIPQTYQVNVLTKNAGRWPLHWFTQTLQIVQTKPSQFYGDTILTFVDSIWTTVPGDNYDFPRWTIADTIWNAKPGEYKICSWSTDPDGKIDFDPKNDTACLYFTILDTVSQIPYCNTFDDPTRYPWASLSKNKYDTLSSFKLGTPNQTIINSAKSGLNAWFTRLNSNYPVLDSSAVYSPLFMVDTSCFQINFDHMFDTENGFDGGTVEYSLDSGLHWKTVGGVYNPRDTSYPWSTGNWFNTPYVQGLGGAPHPPGWTGRSSTGYRYSYRDFRVFDKSNSSIVIVFRFRFGTDGSLNKEGWAFDNFCFQEGDTCIYYSCTDGVKNGFETKIDCGGPDCIPCPSCFDGLWNQNEEATDCGGVCPPCPSCVDAVKNGDEEHIDCGGSKCDPCPSCSDGVLSNNWVESPIGSGIFVQRWEYGIDCGTAAGCVSCWLGVDEINPEILFLGQALPNPAFDKATIGYQIPEDGVVTLKINSTLGVEVFNLEENQTRGIHYESIDVSEWAAGIYYYSIEFNGERLLEKMVVRKD